MSTKPKNSLLGERPEYVIEGEILADGFRDRKTGKLIGEESTPAEVEWVKKASEKIHIEDGDVVVDNAVVIKKGTTKLPIYIDEDDNETERITVNGLKSVGDAQFGADLKVKDDLTAKTIKQSEPNWELEPSNVLVNVPTGISKTIQYCSIREILGNMLQIVLQLKLENTTENDINIGNGVSFEINLPSDIASRILDAEGVALSTAVAEETGISGATLFANNGLGSSYIYSYVVELKRKNNVANVLVGRLRGYGTIRKAADAETHYFLLRTSLNI